MKRPVLQSKRFGVLRMAFRARKVLGIFEKQAPGPCLFGKAGLFICCKGNKSKHNYVSFVPRDAFVLKIQRELCHPKYARKVSGLSRNGPQGRVSGSSFKANPSLVE